LFGEVGSLPVLGLPGNPVSTVVCAAVFLRPAMAVMLGRPEPETALDSAVLAGDLPANDRRQDYLRAELRIDAAGRRVAAPFSRQDSSMLAMLARADCLIVRPPFAAPAEAGTTVPILPLSGGVLGI
jgi:molybdopterin molybdotransferase